MRIEITRFQLNGFRGLWDWLSHHPKKKKEDWTRWVTNGGDVPLVSNDCFLCEALKNNDDGCGEDGENCPADWSPALGCQQREGDEALSVFQKWERAKSPRTIKKYAILVRDIPLNPDTVVVE